MNRLLICLVILVTLTASPSAAAGLPGSEPVRAPDNVLENEVVYHIFQRSFRDSDGDGHGDLRGIQQSLPYLQTLGVTAILMTPLYPSRVYHNYFATDFEGIDPRYGTMEDYRALVTAVHAAGMKIYLDMEFQYLAEGHPWWTAAIADRSSPYADYMLWDDRAAGIAEEGPFGLRELYNFNRDTHGVTTVDLKHPAVRAYFDNYLHDWVDPNRDGDFTDGADGFRLDHMMDDLDSKGILTNLFADFWKPAFDRLRAINPELALIAEQWDWQYGEEYLTDADTSAVFAFPIHDAIRRWDRSALVTAINRTGEVTPEGKAQLIFAENHDVSRIASDPKITPEKLRSAAALMFLLQGTPILYYGQELGMRGQLDAGYASDEAGIPVREAFKWAATDASPGQAIWYRRPGERFWDQRYARDHDGISVEEQDVRPDSLLNRYRHLAALRRDHPALVTGTQAVMEGDPRLLIVERRSPGQRLMVVTNLSAETVVYTGPGMEGPDLIGGGNASLRPWQTALFEAP
jgi:glycosidase